MNYQHRFKIACLVAVLFVNSSGYSAYGQQNPLNDPEYIKTKAELKENEPFRNLPTLDFGTSALQQDAHTLKVKALMKQMGVMVDAITKIYRDSFTMAELELLEAFYTTPVGRKTISLLPAITEAGGREGVKIGKYMGMVIIHEMINE